MFSRYKEGEAYSWQKAPTEKASPRKGHLLIPRKFSFLLFCRQRLSKKILSHGKEQRTKITAIRLAVLHDLMFIKVSNLKRNSCDFSPVL